MKENPDRRVKTVPFIERRPLVECSAPYLHGISVPVHRVLRPWMVLIIPPPKVKLKCRICSIESTFTHFDYIGLQHAFHWRREGVCSERRVKKKERCVLSLTLCTCLAVVYDGLDDAWRGEVDEGKVKQVSVSLNFGGDDVNRRLPLSSAGMAEVGPLTRAVICEIPWPVVHCGWFDANGSVTSCPYTYNSPSSTNHLQQLKQKCTKRREHWNCIKSRILSSSSGPLSGTTKLNDRTASTWGY